MKINFVTLFPSYFSAFQSESIVKRAIENQIVKISVINWRDYSPYKHQQVDDVTYGGGQGMLLMVEPLDRALSTISGHKILLSPQGKTFSQTDAKRLAQYDEITLIAGRYEGFDERVNTFVDEIISIGDYVLTGGELPAMIIADAVVRLLPNVIKVESHMQESFENNLLDFPQYTWPSDYKGMKVPDVLLNGHHAEIKKWRATMQVEKTKKCRPDLWERIKNAK